MPSYHDLPVAEEAGVYLIPEATILRTKWV